MKPPTVVVVDDNPDLVELVELAFEEQSVSMELEVAKDGEKALKLLLDQKGKHKGQWPPSLILLDLCLPRLSGLEVLARLRKEQATALLPVVILTTSNDLDDRTVGYQLGANSFIRKPHISDELFQVIHKLGIYWLDINLPPIDRENVG